MHLPLGLSAGGPITLGSLRIKFRLGPGSVAQAVGPPAGCNSRGWPPGRWGQGLTAEKMKECIWLGPELVAQVEFWSGPGQST
jgi:hypothetical protein